jgi:hypothetical protein
MRWSEIVESVSGTTSGSVATVSMPLGSVQRRADPDSFFGGFTVSDSNPTPNTPDEYKKKKRKK